MKLLCVGDLALGDDDSSKRTWAPPGMIPDNESRTLLNWELPMGDSINPLPRARGPRLLAVPDASQAIQRWSPGFAALATNHILDAGAEGLVNTIESLNKTGFATVGAGRNREEIERTLFWETSEGRLAIINWVFPETHPDWMSVPGPNCWPGPAEAKQAVEKAKGEADWILVFAHWSDELLPHPRPEDRVTARDLAQMGVDLVIGHHPHVVRGMEIIDSCPVFYSLGNLYFSDFLDHDGGWVVKQAPRNREGLGVLISFGRGQKPDYRTLSFWQTKGQVVLDPIRRARRRMEQGSQPLRRFRGLEYADWHAAERACFFRWSYIWHFEAWQLGLRGWARFFEHLSRKYLR